MAGRDTRERRVQAAERARIIAGNVAGCGVGETRMDRRIGTSIARTWLVLIGSLACTAAAAAQLSIPASHPRLWYGVESGASGHARLQRARNFAAQNPVAIPGWSPSDRFRQLALRSLIRGQGDPAADPDCQQAVDWLRGFTLSVGGTSSDQARWDGENAILVYDWCHYTISAADRALLLDRWNGYTAALNAKGWGGLTMPANNYFWGYLRNGLLWGIASYHDGGDAQRQVAQGFLDHALDRRYHDPAQGSGNSRFRSWYEAFGVGGVPLEGLQYGPYMLDYPVIAFTAATDYGHVAWDAVPFWRDAVYWLQYAAPAAKTIARDGATPRFELFPFNDDEFFAGGGSAEGGYGSFLGAMVLRDPDSQLARQAWRWLQLRGNAPAWWVRAELAAIPAPAPPAVLPLDYYADGRQFLYGRAGDAAGATAYMLQLGGANAYTSNVAQLEADGGVGHSHQDLGNFQLWRKGRWITRETTGYDIASDGVRGWNNAAAVDPLEAVAHNTVLFEGRGQVYTRRGWAKVRRLQSATGFAYAAVDMVESYRAPAHQTWLAKDDWPFAEVAIREFVYLRALDALVVLDRLQSGSDSLDPVYDGGYTGPQMPGTQVRKTFVLHATGTGADENGNPFALGSAAATATVGDQRMDLRTLLPAAPVYRVIDEGGRVGQFRLEYDVSGTETTYLLNVVAARDASEAPIGVSLADAGDAWELTLIHPQKGSATLRLRKGLASSGGSVRIGLDPAVALRDDVQGMVIGPQGPAWLGTPFMTTGGNLPSERMPMPAATMVVSTSGPVPTDGATLEPAQQEAAREHARPGLFARWLRAALASLEWVFTSGPRASTADARVEPVRLLPAMRAQRGAITRKPSAALRARTLPRHLDAGPSQRAGIAR